MRRRRRRKLPGASSPPPPPVVAEVVAPPPFDSELDPKPVEPPPLPLVTVSSGMHDISPSFGRRRVSRRGMFSAALVADARAYFEQHLDRPVSDDEARNFLGDFVDFFTAFDSRQ
jgi:hypothetical protein